MPFTDLETESFEIEGFVMKNPAYLKRLGLNDPNLLDLLNRLAEVADDDGKTVANDDWSACSHSLATLVHQNASFLLPSRLYSYIIRTYGPEAININLWVRFVLFSGWPTTVQTFKDMPTDVLEEYGPLWWGRVKVWHNTSNRKEVLLDAIGKRTDIYGAQNMPTELAFGILFEEEEDW